MFTYEAVKKYLFARPIDRFGRNRVASRRCHSDAEKRGHYRHHGKFFYPPKMVKHIFDIEICQDPSLQEWLSTLDHVEREELIKGTQYWEDMRSKDLELRQELKFHWRNEWDPHAINAVGILNFHPQPFGDFVRECMEYRNQLFVKYGVMRWLQSNLYDKYREMKRELKRQKEEMEEKKGEIMEQQRKKRKVMEEDTSETVEETTDEKNTKGETETEEETNSEEE